MSTRMDMAGRGSRLKSSRRIIWTALFVFLFLQSIVMLPGRALAECGENIAGSYKCVAPPDYWGWKQPRHGDHGQLTDGVTVDSWTTPDGVFYSLASSAGWNKEPPVLLFDLGQVRSIGGVGLHSALSPWGPWWPEEITVMVSDDGVNFYLAGPKLQIKPEELDPAVTEKQAKDAYDRVRGAGATMHWYRSCPLEARGRYVGLIMSRSMAGTVVLDEVAIYAGAERGVTARRGQQVFSEGRCGELSYKLYTAINERLSREIEELGTKIAKSAVRGKERDKLLQQLRGLDTRRTQMPVPSTVGFKAILPVNGLHREVFKLQAALWRAQGFSPLHVWKSHRWDPLGPLAEPRGGQPKLSILMAENSFRSDVINLSNSTDQPMHVNFELTDVPAECFDVFEVPLVDTHVYEPVASALLPVQGKASSGYGVEVLGGMTRQIWIRCSSKRLGEGRHDGTIRVTAASADSLVHDVPVSIEVVGVSMPDSLSLPIGGWDYTVHRNDMVTDGNVQQYVAILKEYGVNVPWEAASFAVGTYDKDGNLTSPPDRSEVDQWLAHWPKARIYANVAGALQSRSDAEIVTWAKDWSRYLRSKGISPDKVMILIQDEPNSKAELERILRVGRAIKRGSDFKIFNDLHFGDPTEAPAIIGDVLREASDVQCFNVRHMLSHPDIYDAFMKQHSREGLEWWCYGNADRVSDPYVGWLLWGWFCFDKGLTGAQWWAFSSGCGGSSWNEYFNTRCSYTPLYLAEDSVTTGKSMEAMREGVQDYELLTMLRKKASARGNDASVAESQRILSVRLGEVLAAHTVDNYAWKASKDRSVADAVRAEVLRLLEKAGPSR